MMKYGGEVCQLWKEISFHVQHEQYRNERKGRRKGKRENDLYPFLLMLILYQHQHQHQEFPQQACSRSGEHKIEQRTRRTVLSANDEKLRFGLSNTSTNTPKTVGGKAKKGSKETQAQDEESKEQSEETPEDRKAQGRFFQLNTKIHIWRSDFDRECRVICRPLTPVDRPSIGGSLMVKASRRYY
jgi:hypothetical protein